MLDDTKLDELLALVNRPMFYQHNGQRVPLSVDPETIRALVEEVRDWRASSPYEAPPVHLMRKIPQATADFDVRQAIDIGLEKARDDYALMKEHEENPNG